MKKTCGRCVYPIFAHLNMCLAPFKPGDKRMNYTIDKDTECFAPEFYAENGESAHRRRGMEELEKFKRQLGIKRKK